MGFSIWFNLSATARLSAKRGQQGEGLGLRCGGSPACCRNAWSAGAKRFIKTPLRLAFSRLPKSLSDVTVKDKERITTHTLSESAWALLTSSGAAAPLLSDHKRWLRVRPRGSLPWCRKQDVGLPTDRYHWALCVLSWSDCFGSRALVSSKRWAKWNQDEMMPLRKSNIAVSNEFFKGNLFFFSQPLDEKALGADFPSYFFPWHKPKASKASFSSDKTLWRCGNPKTAFAEWLQTEDSADETEFLSCYCFLSTYFTPGFTIVFIVFRMMPRTSSR